jgi:3-hydroxyisobutyrate dehydrogenase-like beta-hydroxyacid dehydrogenase
MVGNDHDVEQVALGAEGALAAMKKGAVLVDHTTASADIARKVFAEAKKKGVDFIDAPVSGGQAGAENGKLTVMCGGEQGPFDRAKPVMDCYGRAVTLMGSSGAGQLTKMVNQICIAGIAQGLAEAVAFAKRNELNVEKVISVVSKGAAQSWQMENRWKQMDELKADGFGFATEWMRKDMAICLDQARKSGARLPVAALVDQLWAHLEARGGKRWDSTAGLIQLLLKD